MASDNPVDFRNPRLLTLGAWRQAHNGPPKIPVVSASTRARKLPLMTLDRESLQYISLKQASSEAVTTVCPTDVPTDVPTVLPIVVTTVKATAEKTLQNVEPRRPPETMSTDDLHAASKVIRSGLYDLSEDPITRQAFAKAVETIIGHQPFETAFGVGIEELLGDGAYVKRQTFFHDTKTLRQLRRLTDRAVADILALRPQPAATPNLLN